MPSFLRIVPNNLIHAADVNQIIDALDGASGAGIPISVTAVNDATNFALTIQNDDPTNQRALNVLNPSGTSMIRVDSGGVTLGAPLSLPPACVTASELAPNALVGQAVGGDLYGTADVAHIGVQYGSAAYTYDSSNTRRQAWQPTGDNYLQLNSIGAGITFGNVANTARLMTLSDAGTLTVEAGPIIVSTGYISAPAIVSSGYISAGAVISTLGGDLSANRGNGQGYVFFPGSHYIGWDGTNYTMPLGGAYIGGVLHLDANGPNPNTGGAFLTFPQALGPKINLYDVVSGIFFGFGIDSAELFVAVPANDIFSVRQSNGSGPQMFTVNSGNGNTFVAGTLTASGITDTSGLSLSGAVPASTTGQVCMGGFFSGGVKGGSSDSFAVSVNGVTRYVPLYV